MGIIHSSLPAEKPQMKLNDALIRSSAPLPRAASHAAGTTGPEPAPSAAPMDFFTLSGLVPSTLEPLGAYRYAGVSLPELNQPLQAGLLTGAQANARITEAYHALDQAVSDYLGEPAVANWLTFGKYASREAGVQIADLESALGAVEMEPAAFKRLAGGLDDLARAKQSAKAVKAVFQSFQDRLDRTEGGKSFSKQLAFPVYLTGQLNKLKTSLVNGNVGVYGHIAPAFDAFLKAEAAGKDGAAALRKAGFGRAPLDPQGFVLQAFEQYRKARQLRELAAHPHRSSEERLELLALRQNAIGRATLLMVATEQWPIVQGPDVFGDPDIARLTEAMEGTMTIVDALGEHRLLPDGGNWTDFATRMGFKEVKKGADPHAITIRDDEGRTRHYAPKRYDQREGTIFSYFEHNLSEERSHTMIQNAPEPVRGVK